MNRLSLWTVAFSCALIIGLSGCRSFTPPVTYYLLNPVNGGQASPGEAEGKRPMTIGIKPVELPGYVNRIQMVRRTGKNQMEVSSFHRWADYPDRMIQRVVVENLQIFLADARVYSAPWPAGIEPEVTVDLTLFELIGSTEKSMLLSALWTITGKGDPSPSHRTTLSETMAGTGFDDLATAHSRALEVLCREVADALSDFPIQ
jgi:hypothetical protein